MCVSSTLTISAASQRSATGGSAVSQPAQLRVLARRAPRSACARSSSSRSRVRRRCVLGAQRSRVCEALLHPAPGGGRASSPRAARIGGGLESKARLVEPAAALIEDHDDDRETA